MNTEENMKLNLKFLFFLLLIFSASALAQTKNLPKGWKKFKKCGITFSLPSTFKDLDSPQLIEFCVATFRNKINKITILKGENENTFTNYKSIFSDKQERTLVVSNKKAQLTNYIFNNNYILDGNKYFLELILKTGLTSSLKMGFLGKTKNDIEIAKQVFSTIKFEK